MRPFERRRLLGLLGVVLVYVGTGCGESTSSRSAETEETEVDFVAGADGLGVTGVRAELSVPIPDSFPRSVELNGGDRLRGTRIHPVSLAEERQRLTKHRDAFGFHYSKSFGGQAKDTVFEIGFDRSRTGKQSAPDSSVTLPAPIVLDWVENPSR